MVSLQASPLTGLGPQANSATMLDRVKALEGDEDADNGDHNQQYDQRVPR